METLTNNFITPDQLMHLGQRQTTQWFNHTTMTNNVLKRKSDTFPSVIFKVLTETKILVVCTTTNKYINLMNKWRHEMISNDIRKICKDFKKIENYSKAIKDKKTIWHCHHRLEIHSDYTNSAKDLKLMGIYYNRPPEELIFLTPKEHMQLHNNNQKKIDKIKDAHFKKWYGEDYSMEQVEDHRREKNTERLGRWRNRHRKHYTNYQCDYQADFRKNHPNYYSTYKKYVKDRDCGNYDGTFKEWLAENGLKYEDL